MRVEYITHMGTDLTAANSARVSFDKESDWADAKEGEFRVIKEQDERLIKYLARHNHWTPFAHPQITLRYTVPIFVARQEFKHVVGFTRNEISRRYVDNPPEFYVPEVWRSRPEGGLKQGSGDEDKSQEVVYDRLVCRDAYQLMLEHAQVLYESMIEVGIAPEQARMVLPQSMYTSYYITGSLAAFARMYKQRIDASAQKEIQELAEKVGGIVSPLFPVSWEALTS